MKQKEGYEYEGFPYGIVKYKSLPEGYMVLSHEYRENKKDVVKYFAINEEKSWESPQFTSANSARLSAVRNLKGMDFTTQEKAMIGIEVLKIIEGYIKFPERYCILRKLYDYKIETNDFVRLKKLETYVNHNTSHWNNEVKEFYHQNKNFHNTVFLHDYVIGVMVDCFEKLTERIKSNKKFMKSLNSSICSYNKKIRKIKHLPSLSMNGNCINLIIEDIVNNRYRNNTDPIPSEYYYSRFWNEYSKRFLKYVPQKTIEETCEIGDLLISIGFKLNRMLRYFIRKYVKIAKEK